MDWKTRFKNKTFWLMIIPAALLLAQAVAAVFGITLEIGVIEGQLLTIVNAVFSVLVILGVVVDPTTPGIGDGE